MEEAGRSRSIHIRAVLLILRGYQLTFSALLGRQCRYLPTCSDYTREAILCHGLWAGGWMGLARIVRCNPFGADGYDPVPSTLPSTYRWYKPWRGGQWTGRHIATRLS